jgi:hypothetical protein
LVGIAYKIAQQKHIHSQNPLEATLAKCRIDQQKNSPEAQKQGTEKREV